MNDNENLFEVFYTVLTLFIFAPICALAMPFIGLYAVALVGGAQLLTLYYIKPLFN